MGVGRLLISKNRPPAHVIRVPELAICVPKFVICILVSAIYILELVICVPEFVICVPELVICVLAFVICVLFFVIYVPVEKEYSFQRSGRCRQPPVSISALLKAISHCLITRSDFRKMAALGTKRATTRVRPYENPPLSFVFLLLSQYFRPYA